MKVLTCSKRAYLEFCIIGKDAGCRVLHRTFEGYIMLGLLKNIMIKASSGLSEESCSSRSFLSFFKGLLDYYGFLTSEEKPVWWEVLKVLFCITGSEKVLFLFEKDLVIVEFFCTSKGIKVEPFLIGESYSRVHSAWKLNTCSLMSFIFLLSLFFSLLWLFFPLLWDFPPLVRFVFFRAVIITFSTQEPSAVIWSRWDAGLWRSSKNHFSEDFGALCHSRTSLCSSKDLLFFWSELVGSLRVVTRLLLNCSLIDEVCKEWVDDCKWGVSQRLRDAGDMRDGR